MLNDFIQWYLGALDAGGYWLVALLMALESSVVPLPSELVVPPAAHLAVTTGRMSLVGIVIAGAIGSWVGASAMYWVARGLGRPLLVSYGRYARITPEAIAAAEAWSHEFGAFGAFVARFLPVIRHLIGIPAGIVRVNYGWYSLATLLGSAIWTAVLCYVGIKAGQDKALLAGDMHQVTLWLVGGVAVLAVIYWLFVHRIVHRKRPR